MRANRQTMCCTAPAAVVTWRDVDLAGIDKASTVS